MYLSFTVRILPNPRFVMDDSPKCVVEPMYKYTYSIGYPSKNPLNCFLLHLACVERHRSFPSRISMSYMSRVSTGHNHRRGCGLDQLFNSSVAEVDLCSFIEGIVVGRGFFLFTVTC